MPYFIHQNHRLFYREEGSGPLLLILPGNTASSACHQGELAYFGRRYHAVSLDFWGTGQSDRLEEWPENWWEEGAHDAAALVEHLGEESGIAIGTSGGAVVALLMAILHPARVRAVIADSEVEHYPLAWMRNNMKERTRRTPEQIGFWQYAQGADWEQVVDADSAMLLRMAGQGGDPFHGRLPQIRCPVLFTGSLCDRMLPPHASEQVCGMAEQVAGSRLYLANEGDHPLMWTCPEAFRRASDNFISSLPEA